MKEIKSYETSPKSENIVNSLTYDTSSKLKNLLTNARRSKEKMNFIEAKNFYAAILIEKPDFFEAEYNSDFCGFIASASVKSAGSTAMSIMSNFPNYFAKLQVYFTHEERTKFIESMTNDILFAAGFLHRIIANHVKKFDKAINLDERYAFAENIKRICKMLGVFGDILLEEFEEDYSSFAISVWRKALTELLNSNYVPQLDLFIKGSSCKEFVNEYSIKLKQFQDYTTLNFSDQPGLEIIKESAFSCHDHIETVVIPKSVKRIEEDAFRSCTNLKTLIFEENSNLEFIGNTAFFRCNIEEIVFPSELKSIGSSAFSRNPELKKVTLPKKLQSIGSYAFDETKVKKVIGQPQKCKVALNAFPNIFHVLFVSKFFLSNL